MLIGRFRVREKLIMLMRKVEEGGFEGAWDPEHAQGLHSSLWKLEMC